MLCKKFDHVAHGVGTPGKRRISTRTCWACGSRISLGASMFLRPGSTIRTSICFSSSKTAHRSRSSRFRGHRVVSRTPSCTIGYSTSRSRSSIGTRCCLRRPSSRTGVSKCLGRPITGLALDLSARSSGHRVELTCRSRSLGDADETARSARELLELWDQRHDWSPIATEDHRIHR